MVISTSQFDAQYAHLSDVIQRVSGAPFLSFRTGMAAEWEEYKVRLHQRASALLGISDWREDSIGKGEVLDRVIAAIEIDNGNERNNLVRWENRFGHASRSHRALLDARLDDKARRHLDHLFFDLYKDSVVEADIFEELRSYVGNRYDLLAYLFFLKDIGRFMPIATQTFDQAFSLLGIDLATTGRCSWENYTDYNNALGEIWSALRNRASLFDARLIDAHSFCWMLVRVDAEALRRETQKIPPNKKAIIYDSRQKWVYQMVATALETVKNSGRMTQYLLKSKECGFPDRYAMEKYVTQLLEIQDNRCALTGLSLRYAKDDDPFSNNFLASLDRKDSSKHYEPNNLQVVCRFVNFWKGDSANEEFSQLLDAVRGDGSGS